MRTAISIGLCRRRARCYTTGSRRWPNSLRRIRDRPMPDDLIGAIQETHLKDALSERYLAYALSTIMSRSLPDVRDGLKPVHRRLIYAMHQLKLGPPTRVKKNAPPGGGAGGENNPPAAPTIFTPQVPLGPGIAPPSNLGAG